MDEYTTMTLKISKYFTYEQMFTTIRTLLMCAIHTNSDEFHIGPVIIGLGDKGFHIGDNDNELEIMCMTPTKPTDLEHIDVNIDRLVREMMLMEIVICEECTRVGFFSYCHHCEDEDDEEASSSSSSDEISVYEQDEDDSQ